MYDWRGISRDEIVAQCTRHCAALAVRSPLTSIFISTIIISFYATLPLKSFFQLSFVAIFFTAFLFVPIVYCYSTLSCLFVFVSNPVLCCPCLLPLPSSIFVYGIWFLLHSLLFYPTSHKASLSSIFPLPLHSYFLALVVASFVLFSSSSTYALFSVHW